MANPVTVYTLGELLLIGLQEMEEQLASANQEKEEIVKELNAAKRRGKVQALLL